MGRIENVPVLEIQKLLQLYLLMEKTQETVQESEPKATSALFTPCLQAVHQD